MKKDDFVVRINDNWNDIEVGRIYKIVRATSRGNDLLINPTAFPHSEYNGNNFEVISYEDLVRSLKKHQLVQGTTFDKKQVKINNILYNIKDDWKLYIKILGVLIYVKE